MILQPPLGTQLGSLHIGASCKVETLRLKFSLLSYALPFLIYSHHPPSFLSNQINLPFQQISFFAVPLWHLVISPDHLSPYLQTPPCQGMTSFPLQSCLRVFPTLTSDIFGILQTPTAFQFQKCFRVFPILSLFQQAPTLSCAPYTPPPHPIPPLKAALRPPPPPKVTWRSLLTCKILYILL